MKYRNSQLFRKLSLFFFITVFLTLCLSFSYAATYPNLELDKVSKIDDDEINITGQACFGCEVSLFINGQLKAQQRIESPTRVINWNDEPRDIEMVAGERFRINYTPSAGDDSTTYQLEVFGQTTETVSIFELSSEYEFSSLDFDSERINLIIEGFSLGGDFKTVFFSDELTEFHFDDLDRSDFIAGQNVVKIVVSGSGFGGASLDVEDSFNVEVEKYSIQFEISDETDQVANVGGATIVGKIVTDEDISGYGFAYLVNGPGEIISNTGLMRNFDLNITDNSFNFSITTESFREGFNTLDLIGYTLGNRGNFVAFQRINITRDSVPPNIIITSVEMYDSGDLVNNFSGAQITDTIFSGFSDIVVRVEVDADTISYEYDTDSGEEIIRNGSAIIDFTPKKGDDIVDDVSDAILDGKSTNEIIEELGVEEGTIAGINNALRVLEDQDLPRNSEWFEQVARDLGLGYNLILRAVDEGGNRATRTIRVIFDDEDPELIIDEMKPASIFKDGEVFSSIEYIEGRTNQPFVEVSFLVLGEDDFVQTKDGDTQQLSCDDAFEYFKRGIWRNSNFDVEDDEFEGVFKFQFADVVDLIRGSLDFRSDQRGYFGESSIIEAVVKGDFIQFRSNVDSEDRSSVSPNELCVMLRNKFGRVTLEEFSVDYLAGNFDWDVNGVTFNQNSINPYEIESSTANSGYRTGVVVELKYVGQFGDSEDLDFNQVQVRKRGSDPREVRVVSSEVVYFYKDKTLNLFIPLEFSKRDLLVSEYPDTEIITLEILPRATVQGFEIDNTNPEFIDIEVYYDKDLATKWLTPEMIDKGIAFLNSTKRWTGKLRNTTRQLVPIGALTCVGAKFWYSFQSNGLDPNNPEHKEQLEDLQEKLYYACDRTFCSAAPYECSQDSQGGEEGSLYELQRGADGKVPAIDPNQLTPEQRTGFQNDGARTKVFEIDPTFGGSCITETGRHGVYVRGSIVEYIQDDNSFFQAKDATSESLLPTGCREYIYDEEKLAPLLEACKNEPDAAKRAECTEKVFGEDALVDALKTCNTQSYTGTDEEKAAKKAECLSTAKDSHQLIKGFDLTKLQNSCYKPEAPHFDDARCLEAKGYDPADSIIESARCGCIPETYQHLNKIYKIQENIQECLEDVKSAEVEGTYCERLISVSMCDVATGLLFKFAESKPIYSQPRADPGSGLLGILGTLQSTDSLLQNRYEGSSLYSNTNGINTKNIANSLCLFAINKDFAAFEAALLGDIDTGVQVAPSYTFTLPHSKFESYNPITGELTISYKFTHNGISGGSPVTFTYDLICDSSQPNGDYCPTGVVRASDINPAVFRTKTLTIPGAGEAQELIEIRDTSAVFAYNVLETVVEYSIGDEQKRYVHQEKIARGQFDILGSGAFQNCIYLPVDLGIVSGGIGTGGISCNSQFGDLSDVTAFQIDSRTHVAPQDGSSIVLYPGSYVGINVFYTIRGGAAFNSDKGSLWYKSSCGTSFGEIELDERQISGTAGNFYAELFQIPASDASQGFKVERELEYTSGDANVISAVRFANRRDSEDPTQLIIKEVLVNGRPANLASVGDVIFKIKDDGTLEDHSIILDNLNRAIKAEIDSRERFKLEIIFDRDPKSLQLTIETSKGTFAFGVASEILDDSVGKTCTIELRMTGSGVELTEATFNKDLLEESGAQVDARTAQRVNDVYTTSFITKKRNDESAKYQAEFIFPTEDLTICVDNSGVPSNLIPLVKIENSGETAISIEEFTEDLEGKLYLERFAQDPVLFSLNEDSNFESLLRLDYSSGAFRGVEFDTSQSGRFTISKISGEEITRRNVELRLC